MKITESQLKNIVRRVINEEIASFSPRDRQWNDIVIWVNAQVKNGASEEEIKGAFDDTLSTVFAGIKKRKTLSGE